MDDDKKQCCSCKTLLSLSVFGLDRSQLDGLAVRCKPCECQRKKIERTNFPERNRERGKKYESSHPEQTKAKRARYRANNLEERRAADRLSQKRFRENRPAALRARRLWNNYHLTVERYFQILEFQVRRCGNPGCLATEPGGNTNGTEMSWCVDHDHSCCSGSRSCGKCVRGLLCSKCNVALAMVQDSQEKLKGLLRYLEHWRHVA